MHQTKLLVAGLLLDICELYFMKCVTVLLYDNCAFIYMSPACI